MLSFLINTQANVEVLDRLCLCVSSDLVFGCSLSSLCQRENSTVPAFVKMCIDYVDSSGGSLHQPGGAGL